MCPLGNSCKKSGCQTYAHTPLRDTLVPYINVVFSFTQFAVVTQLVSGFLSKGIVLCVTVDSVCSWEEMSSGASWVTILDWNPFTHFKIGLSVLNFKSYFIFWMQVVFYRRILIACVLLLKVLCIVWSKYDPFVEKTVLFLLNCCGILLNRQLF